jgi:uncharacterized membrane protein
MVEAVQFHSLLLHIHIVYLESVGAHSYAVDRHMSTPLHCYTAGQVNPDLGNLGMVGWNNDLLLWLRLYNSTHFFSTSILYMWKVFEPIHMMWIGIWVHLCTVTMLAKLTQIWVILGWWGEIMFCCYCWACTIPLIHIHIVYVESFWAHSYDVDRHVGAPSLHCYTAGQQVDPDLGNLGMVGWNNDVMTWLRLYNTIHLFSTSMLYMWKVFEHIHMLWIDIWVHLSTITLLAKLIQIWVILLNIHIVYLESVWAHSYDVDRYVGAPFHCYTGG